MEEKKRYVIQRHTREDEPAHWDLMLESAGVLETYRINKPPEEWGKDPIEAAKIFDHPLKFLTYEGSVNKGKGMVAIADKGTYEDLSQNENQLKIRFSGTILKTEIIFAAGGGRVRRE
jgi:bifunctional non-homologous end joining protein LigD